MRIKHTEQFYIGVDIGTTALKAVLIDSRAEVLAEYAVVNELNFGANDQVEFDAEQRYHALCTVTRALTAVAPCAVSALAMAAASGNTLLCDQHGKPSGPAISWMDQRCVHNPPSKLTAFNESDVREITGWPCIKTFPLAHLAWLHENASARFHSAAHIGMDTDWLVHRLTGLWALDHSSATTFHLRNQRSDSYHQPYLDQLEIAPEKLSTLMCSGEIIGALTARAAHETGLSEQTMLVSGSFDHPAAARAAHVLHPGELLLSCGTSWVGFLPHPDRAAIIEARLLCDPFLSANGGPWAGMFSVPQIGRNIDWYVEHLIAPGEKVSEQMRAFDSMAASVASGANGLTIDLSQPPQQINAAPAMISRAVMEGAARLLNEKIIELTAHGFHYKRAVMVGGASRSPIWPGIVAEFTGLEVTAGDRSAGARGAAMLATQAGGEEKPLAEVRRQL
jgi:xylulokinase